MESRAFESGGYVTPESVSQQVSPGQLQESYAGVGLGGTKVYATLTSRYRLRVNDYASDQDFYQYLRIRTDAMKLGQGTVRLSTYARFAQDLDGDYRKSDNYYFFRDALDAQLRHDDWAPRLYLGTATLDGVIKNTTLNLGRVNLAHQNAFLLDGGDATVKLGDAVSAYVYGGKPVSFYYHTGGDTLVGGGVTVKAARHTSLGAEYVRLHVKGDNNDYTKLRIDQGIPNGTIALAYTMLDDAGTVNADVAYEIAATNTILTAKYEGLLKDVGNLNNYVVNPLTNTLLDESRYNKYEAGVYQAFLKYFAVGATYAQRIVSGSQNLDNRSYARVGGKFDIIGLPSDNTYISLSADYWGVKATATTAKNASVQYGAQVNQKITPKVDVWGGTSYNRYDYDINPNLSGERRMSWARSYYVGAQYQPTRHISFMADLSLEHGSFYNDISNSLNTNYKSEIWANLIF
ncbi:hypothetical protein FO488_05570 [Geobacter sp. FeAm09]|uniref:hypothetical protein n=1 Tax=Geobacter sp. FeAm09 TaxID=2597769 RepID=UPI0011EBCA89|nr:hypothetical protein [Geobacter sp. FeAm09]QEM67672.1 hypothetical protein FO488_05570 [Geobacter sp. FeAm09]